MRDKGMTKSNFLLKIELTFEIKRFEHFAASASSSWLLFSWRESLLIIKMNFPKKGRGQL